MGGGGIASGMQCFETLCGCLFSSRVTIIAPPSITLDPQLTGSKANLSDRNSTISGDGISLGGCSLQQDRAYFEARITKTDGSFQVGIANRRAHKDKPLGDDPNLSWVFQSHPKLAVGDVIVSTPHCTATELLYHVRAWPMIRQTCLV